MPATLKQSPQPMRGAPAPTGLGTVTPAAERQARTDLRRQIADLERQLGELFASAFSRRDLDWGIGAVGGPRVLSIGDLERVRDSLALRLRDARSEIARRAEVEERNRGELERMIAAPERHHWLLISNEDIGEPGCRHWHSRPRWGILGMLFGWWRIRLSSGCPLVEGLRPPAPAVKNRASHRRRTSASDPRSMAKKRRKRRPRAAAPAPVAAKQPGKQPAAKPRALIEDERPPAPWGSFPLVELVVLVALVMLVAGLIVSGERGTALLVTGLGLGSLAGLELSIREHFAGYRSHTLLLAGAAGVITLGVLFYAVPDLLPPVGRVAVGLAVAGLAAFALARAFQARSGRVFKLR